MIPNGSAYANYPSFANNGTKTPPGGSVESAKYALGMVPADTFPAEWANYLFHGATAGITRLNQDVGSIKKEINTVLSEYGITNDASVFNQLLAAILKTYPKATTCSTAAGTQEKSLAISGNVLKTGDIYVVTMTNANTYGDGSTTYPTLSINSGTAYPLIDTFGHYLKSGSWEAGEVLTLIFTGSHFLVQTHATSTVADGNMNPPTSHAVWNKIKAMYPVGTVYQNKTDGTNPGTLFGFGTWVQITDRFLIARGSTYHGDANGQGGSATYTLSESNIPAHNHAMGGPNNDQTSGEPANIISIDISHNHGFDASHKHSIYDPGHSHRLAFDAEGAYTLYRNYGGAGGNNALQSITTEYTGYLYAGKDWTGISETQWETISSVTGAASVSQIGSDKINQGLHSHALATYGLSSPTAISIIPPYQAVYTWYRSA